MNTWNLETEESLVTIQGWLLSDLKDFEVGSEMPDAIRTQPSILHIVRICHSRARSHCIIELKARFDDGSAKVKYLNLDFSSNVM